MPLTFRQCISRTQLHPIKFVFYYAIYLSIIRIYNIKNMYKEWFINHFRKFSSKVPIGFLQYICAFLHSFEIEVYFGIFGKTAINVVIFNRKSEYSCYGNNSFSFFINIKSECCIHFYKPCVFRTLGSKTWKTDIVMHYVIIFFPSQRKGTFLNSFVEIFQSLIL